MNLTEVHANTAQAVADAVAKADVTNPDTPRVDLVVMLTTSVDMLEVMTRQARRLQAAVDNLTAERDRLARRVDDLGRQVEELESVAAELARQEPNS